MEVVEKFSPFVSSVIRDGFQIAKKKNKQQQQPTQLQKPIIDLLTAKHSISSAAVASPPCHSKSLEEKKGIDIMLWLTLTLQHIRFKSVK